MYKDAFPKALSLFAQSTLMVQFFEWIPDHSGGDLGAEENAQVADGVGREHANDGEGDGEVPIQLI